MRGMAILRIAFWALGRNKMRSALTMLGIIIGVSAVIAMVSIGQGAQAMVQDQMEAMGSNIMYVYPSGRRRFGGARMGSDHGDAQHTAILGGHDLDHAAGLPLRLGPVIFGEGKTQDIDLTGLPPGGLFPQAHMGQFRVRVGHPRDLVRPFGLGGEAKKRVADDDARVMARHMGELQAARHIANGVNFFVGSPQAAVHGDALGRIFHARRFQVQTIHIGLSPGGQQ